MHEPSSEQVQEDDLAKLLVALRQRDEWALLQLVKDQPDLADTHDLSGRSLLMHALHGGFTAVTREIRQARSSLDVHEAAALGEAHELRRLVCGVPERVNQPGSDGLRPLHLAALFAQRSSLTILVAHGAEVDAPAQTEDKQLPLHCAVQSGQDWTVQSLLAAGASPNGKMRGGISALHAAAASDNVGMIRALLAAGARTTIRNDAGKTPIEVTPLNAMACQQALGSAL